MSGPKVEFTPEALREIDDAFERYLEQSRQAAEAFVREVEKAVALIAGTFPYSVVYREIPAGIVVIAVAHHKRRPRYWIGRLRRNRAR